MNIIKKTGELDSQVEVFSTDDNGVGHLRRVNDTGEDTTANGDIAGERALLVDVGTVNSLYKQCTQVSAGM